MVALLWINTALNSNQQKSSKITQLQPGGPGGAEPPGPGSRGQRSRQWRSEGPAGPATAGGPADWRGPPGARQEEVVAVTPWPGAQTSCCGGPENRRYATGSRWTILRGKVRITIHYRLWRGKIPRTSNLDTLHKKPKIPPNRPKTEKTRKSSEWRHITG